MAQLQALLGEDGVRWAIWIGLGFAALLAALLLVFIIRRIFAPAFNLSSSSDRRGRPPRLGVTDFFNLDRAGRRLVIVRRDNVEHLVLVGGPNDILIESNIVRGSRSEVPVVDSAGRPSVQSRQAELVPLEPPFVEPVAARDVPAPPQRRNEARQAEVRIPEMRPSDSRAGERGPAPARPGLSDETQFADELAADIRAAAVASAAAPVRSELGREISERSISYRPDLPGSNSLNAGAPTIDTARGRLGSAEPAATPVEIALTPPVEPFRQNPVPAPAPEPSQKPRLPTPPLAPELDRPVRSFIAPRVAPAEPVKPQPMQSQPMQSQPMQSQQPMQPDAVLSGEPSPGTAASALDAATMAPAPRRTTSFDDVSRRLQEALRRPQPLASSAVTTSTARNAAVPGGGIKPAPFGTPKAGPGEASAEADKTDAAMIEMPATDLGRDAAPSAKADSLPADLPPVDPSPASAAPQAGPRPGRSSTDSQLAEIEELDLEQEMARLLGRVPGAKS